MRKILGFLKRIWILNFVRRIFAACKYYNFRYLQIIRWGFSSREDTNYTYHLTRENISYLAHTIAVVTGARFMEVMNYINELQNDESLRNSVLEASTGSDLRRFSDMDVRFGRRIGWYVFARILKPRVIVETGVDKGFGSMVLCSALLRNREEGFQGKYYGTDINPAAGYLLTGKYREAGEILYGDSIESLNKLDCEIDLFINDSDHSADYEYREYQAIKRLITDSTIILGDNSHCTDKLAIFSEETGRDFLFFREEPANHWYPGAGIGISFRRRY